jgi:hypothetical protein
VTPKDFFETKWEFLEMPLTPPRKAEKLDKHGAEAIAETILNLF